MNEVRNIMIGIEFGEKTSQISYYDRSEKEPVSLSALAGASQYVFPTCLSKKPQEDLWHFGLEAEQMAGKGEIFLNNLYEIAMQTEMVSVDEREMKASEILCIYFRQVLDLLGISHPVKNIISIMVTVPRISKALVDNIRDGFAAMKYPRESCFIQTYEESFFYYTISQKKDFWNRGVGLFSIDREKASFRRLVIEKMVNPKAAFVRRGKSQTLDSQWEKRDEEFVNLIKDSFGSDIYSGVFLIGDGFDKKWAVKSVPLLCANGRKVYYGNNLFCKGACYGAKARVEGSGEAISYRGEDMIRVDMGMELQNKGLQTYFPIVHSGSHWYEARNSFEILLENSDTLVFLAGKPRSNSMNRYAMPLEGLPKRPAKATRLKIDVSFISVSQCRIRVEDLGLGELFPASGKVWEENLEQ